MTTRNKASRPDSPRTLTDVAEALARIRPAQLAPLAEWLAYHQRAGRWYAEVAEIDRGHHHEALSMAEHERERAKEIETRIATQQSSGTREEGVNDEGHCDSGPTKDVDAGS